jgi:hypothetical protein
MESYHELEVQARQRTALQSLQLSIRLCGISSVHTTYCDSVGCSNSIAGSSDITSSALDLTKQILLLLEYT